MDRDLLHEHIRIANARAKQNTALNVCCNVCLLKLRKTCDECKNCDKHLKEPREIECIDCGKKIIAETFMIKCPHCEKFQVLCDFCEKQNKCDGGFGDPNCGFVELNP